jgi:hypothetical protein
VLLSLDFMFGIREFSESPFAKWRALIQQVGASVDHARTAVRAHAFGAAGRNARIRLKLQWRYTYVANLGMFKFKFAVGTLKNPLGHESPRIADSQKAGEHHYVRYRTNKEP